MSAESMIELQGVSHVYVSKLKANLAVENINLKVNKGEFVSIVGPSGCGKSTILSCISGLIHPTEGKVLIHGQSIDAPSSKVGYMLQSDYLFEWQTIQQNVVVGLKIMGGFTQEHEKHANFLLHEMGLSNYQNAYPSQLSGGMRQRAALVRTLVTNPDILLLDEPFSALDYQTKLKLEDLVYTTLRKHKKTAILVTHDIAESIAMSDRILILEREPGKIKREIHVPQAIRDCLPFYAREEEEFNELFHTIWKELETHENKRE